MILQLLQKHLREQTVASLAQMEASLGVPAEALRGMLDLLERKGRVEKMPRPLRCHGCSLCDGNAPDIYRWQENLGGATPSEGHRSSG